MDLSAESESCEQDVGASNAVDGSPSEAVEMALRIWPAILIVLVIWAVRYSALLVEEPTMNHRMWQFLGPAIVSLLVPLWWCFFSRAKIKEKILGIVGLAIISGVLITLEDRSIFGFGTIIFVVPVGMTAFALGTILMRGSSPARVISGLLAAFMGFGYWTLVRTDEMTGALDTVQRWRWEPTPEDEFLATLEDQQTATDTVELKAEDLANSPWPAFRGANRTGIVQGITINPDWQANPPKELWRIKLGPGWSSFSVAGKRLFTQEQRGEKEAVVCYDADTGQTVWVYEDKSRFWESIGGAGPRATPTLSADALYSLGANGILNCLEPTSGKLVWSQDISVDADKQPPTWGFSSSPLVTDGLVIVHAGGPDDKGLLAYATDTGELKWSCASGNHTYSSPQLSTVDGKRCLLMLDNTGLTFHEVETGKEIGHYDMPFAGYRVLQPLVLGDKDVLIGTPMDEGTQRITAKWRGTEFVCTEAWPEPTRNMKAYYNDFVVHDGYLYGFDNGIFACVDLQDGSRRWKRGRYGYGQVLLLSESGQLVVAAENGDIVLLDATPEKQIELGKLKVFDSRVWNHPTVVGNRLYVRNGEEAVCLELNPMNPSNLAPVPGNN